SLSACSPVRSNRQTCRASWPGWVLPRRPWAMTPTTTSGRRNTASQPQRHKEGTMPDPQPIPINAKFEGDFVTQLVVVLDTDTMREVAAKTAYHVVGKRLPRRDA